MQKSIYVKAAGARINAWREPRVSSTEEGGIVLTFGSDDGPLTLALSNSDAVQIRAVLERALRYERPGEVSLEEKIERG